MSNKRILILDDEPTLQQAIAKYLGAHGFQVTCLSDPLCLDEHIENDRIDLLILDQVMPGEDGLSITKRIRAAGNMLPILMLSGFADDTDRIVGLEIGVDDYLAKPPNVREVLARVKALLRRSWTAGGTSAVKSDAKPYLLSKNYWFGPYRLNLESRQLFKNEQLVKLTDADYRLLKIFVENPKKELSRDKLSEILKGYEHEPFDRSIDVQVKRLRSKIEDDKSSPQYIVTVWRTGYQFFPSGRNAQ